MRDPNIGEKEFGGNASGAVVVIRKAIIGHSDTRMFEHTSAELLYEREDVKAG